jgi:DNA-binding CsgD family transcriptional regulator
MKGSNESRDKRRGARAGRAKTPRRRDTRSDAPHGLVAPSARDVADVLAAPQPGALLFTPEEWQLVTAAVGLSPRERQVAWMLLEGRSRKMIARRLRNAHGEPLHVGTVDDYIQRLFQKLRVTHTTDISHRLLALRRQVSHGDGASAAPAPDPQNGARTAARRRT